ncbi:hypothetical protein BDA99DRAFT_537037 [Phascolomyces articulosus]|uniref:Uncharacterized protein n=1 Tax=Phascolomyces articulosus TaxID=60185 RepID=A0AAD5PEW4_9FUNG|nr:hypothetical protein BDA99DRAFT_537037 [Phascolomyces articulosus]
MMKRSKRQRVFLSFDNHYDLHRTSAQCLLLFCSSPVFLGCVFQLPVEGFKSWQHLFTMYIECVNMWMQYQRFGSSYIRHFEDEIKYTLDSDITTTANHQMATLVVRRQLTKKRVWQMDPYARNMVFIIRARSIAPVSYLFWTCINVQYVSSNEQQLGQTPHAELHYVLKIIESFEEN